METDETAQWKSATRFTRVFEFLISMRSMEQRRTVNGLESFLNILKA